MTDEREADTAGDAALRAFRALYDADLRGDIYRPASEYRRLFADLDAVVDEELRRLRSGGDGDSAPPEPAPASAAPTPTLRTPESGGRDSGTGVTSTLAILRDRPRTPLSQDELIGEGGMGAIYRVRDEALRRELAMKVIRRRPGAPCSPWAPDGAKDETVTDVEPAVRRFVDEAQITSQLDHPGVVPVHELGLDAEGNIFFTMKLVKGRELGEIFALARERAEGWTRTKVLQLLIRICETLAFAHSKGVIHRDLKPANIMVGSFGEVYVMDWGLAKHGGRAEEPNTDVAAIRTDLKEDTNQPGSQGLTHVGAVIGTPGYLAPEQPLGGELTALSDIYAIGAMLYEFLSGRMPYNDPERKRSPVDLLVAVRKGPPASLTELAPELPVELCAIAEKAMAYDAPDRYASAEELSEDLYAFLEGRVVRAYRTGPLVELRKWVGRNRGLAVAAIIALIVTLIGSITYAMQANAAAAKAREAAQKEREAAVEIRKQRDAAEAAADRERAAARRAEGARLSAVATERADENPTLALLLAVEGAERTSAAEARTALYAALARLRERFTLVGHDNYVSGAKFTPDGTRIVTWGRESQVLLWDATTGALLRRMDEHEGEVVTCDIGADGRHIVTASMDGTARVWDLDTGRTVMTLAPEGAETLRAALSPDGTRVVTWSREKDRVLRLWDVKSGELLHTYDGHGASVVNGFFTADGRHIVSTSLDKTVRFWGTASGEERHRIEPESGPPPPGTPAAWRTWAAVNPVNGVVAVIDPYRQQTRVIDVESGEELRCFENVHRAAWSLDGSRLVVVGAGGIQAHDLGSGESLPAVSLAARLASWKSEDPAKVAHVIRVDRTGRVVAARGAHSRAAITVGLQAGGTQDYVGHTYYIEHIDLTADGTLLATASRDRTVRVWMTKPPLDVPFETALWPPYWLSPDAGHAVTWERRSESLPPPPPRQQRGRLRVIDTRTGRVRQIAEDARPTFASFSSDGSRFAYALSDRRIGVYDCASGEEVCRVDDPFLPVDGGVRLIRLQFTLLPDGRRLVHWSAGPDGWIGVTDVATGQRLLRTKWPHPPAASGWGWPVFDPTGMRVAIPYPSKHTVLVWDLGEGREVGWLKGHTGHIISVEFSPDGRWIGTSAIDSTVRIWNARTLKRQTVVSGLPMEEVAVRFSPDGELVAVNARTAHVSHVDGVHLFHVSTGARFADIEYPGDAVTNFVFTGDGTQLLTRHTSGVTRRWPLDPLAYARGRMPRELTPAERDRFGVGTEAERAEANVRRLEGTHSVSAIYSWGRRRLLRDGRPDDAEKWFARAVEFRPRAPHGHYGRALLLCVRGEPAAALESLERAAELGVSARVIEREETLEPLRSLPGYRALLERIAPK